MPRSMTPLSPTWTRLSIASWSAANTKRPSRPGLRRYPARVLHVQQPGERVPHLRWPRRPQTAASGADGAGPAPQHRQRLLRARGLSTTAIRGVAALYSPTRVGTTSRTYLYEVLVL